MGCIFCSRDHDSVREDVLFESEHFYVKACLASVAAGHVLIIPKEHFSCYGALARELDQEYLEVKHRTIEKVKELFSEPFLLEHGVWGQSVAHAHTHCIPLVGDGYSISSIFDEIIFPSKVSSVEGGLDLMRDVYSQQGAYFAVEERGRNLVCLVAGFSHDEWMPKLGYRHFFRRFFPGAPLLWKDACDEDRLRDVELRALTRRSLRF